MPITIEKRDGKDWVVHSDLNWARPATPDESALWSHKDARIAELETAIQGARELMRELWRAEEIVSDELAARCKGFMGGG